MRPRVLAIALALAGAAAAPAALADGATVTKETLARAATRFREGEAAFRRHEYAAAADAFEDAYRIAPHPSALFNAADARQKAGELARAANLCAHYLSEAPAKDANRADAAARLADLRPKLGRIEVQVEDATGLALDGTPIHAGETFVDPGDHVVAATIAGKPASRRVTIAPGTLQRVILDAVADPSALPPPAAAPAPDSSPPAAPSPKGLSPSWFWVGAGATALAGGATVWSGLDTSRARSDFDLHPTVQGLDDGRAKQTRTNVLLGATAVLGVATAAVAIFAVDWRPRARVSKPVEPASPDVTLLVGPAGASVAGRF